VDRHTIEIYDTSVAEYESARTPKHRRRAQVFAARLAPGSRCADLGCGPGVYLGDLPAPAIALDASAPMLRRARTAVPGSLPVQADLEALPFRRGALGGGWARNSYVHVAKTALPAALAELHQALAEDGPAVVSLLTGDDEGVLGDDDLPGRFFARWPAAEAEAIVEGAGFVVEDRAAVGDATWLHLRRRGTLPDFVGPSMRVLVCGLNPSLVAAAAGFGYAGATNRFWPAAVAAGLVSVPRRPLRSLRVDGVGMTDMAKRATRRADELDPAEYREGAVRVRRLVEWLRPAAVLFVGLAGYRAAVDRKAAPGWQADPFGGAPAYVMPSTSGLNAHAGLADLTGHMLQVVERAER
jgi:TDG/mug DNA glycosylase family protein